jgi:hypothetical protein
LVLTQVLKYDPEERATARAVLRGSYFRKKEKAIPTVSPHLPQPNVSASKIKSKPTQLSVSGFSSFRRNRV